LLISAGKARWRLVGNSMIAMAFAADSPLLTSHKLSPADWSTAEWAEASTQLPIASPVLVHVAKLGPSFNASHSSKFQHLT
jgi:hypothetical protein